MTQRPYEQYCATARTLDLVGARWTLLVIRELLTGPRRFKDLRDCLPGVGTALLTGRLRALEDAGLVRRSTLPPPAGVAVYELTAAGSELRPVVMAIARWGLRWLLREPYEGEVFRPSWAVLALQATFDSARAKGVRESYEFRVGDDVFHVDIDDGAIDTGHGPAADPKVVISTDEKTFAAVAARETTLAEAAEQGAVEVDGSTAALRRLERCFRPPEPADLAS